RLARLFLIANVADDTTGNAYDECVGRDILRHNRPRADECSLPYRDPGNNRDIRANRGTALNERRRALPVIATLEFPIVVRRLGANVIREHYPVADEHLILDDNAFAQERVRRDLTTCAHTRTSLDLDEGADLCFVTDGAAIEIDQIRMKYLDATTK